MSNPILFPIAILNIEISKGPVIAQKKTKLLRIIKKKLELVKMNIKDLNV